MRDQNQGEGQHALDHLLECGAELVELLRRRGRRDQVRRGPTHDHQLEAAGLVVLATGVALGLLLVAWLPLGLGSQHLAGLIVGVVLLDLGGQAVHVLNQSLIFRLRPEAHSRLVGAYMLFYAAGSGLGAMLSTQVYASAGWSGVCLLGAALSVAALMFWAATAAWMRGKGR